MMPERTRSGKKTAYADVKGKLQREYGKNSSAVYATLNKIGLMRGNKVTRKGAKAARMQTAHEARAHATRKALERS